ncbi:MAG: hypothetical protein ACR2NA_10970 [Solirubrobacterales bacterium]
MARRAGARWHPGFDVRAPGAALLAAVALTACGSDDPAATVTERVTVTEATGGGPENGTGTTSEATPATRTGADFLAAPDNLAVEGAQDSLLRLCGGGAETDAERRELDDAVQTLIRIHEEDPEARYVPSARPESDRPMSEVLSETVDGLGGECMPVGEIAKAIGR